MRSRHKFVPEQVNLLPIQVPSDMKGGTVRVVPGQPRPASLKDSLTKLKKWHAKKGAKEHAEEGPADLMPIENSVIAIPGDASLHVANYSSELSAADARFVALVLEQYNIPAKYLPAATDFALYSNGDLFAYNYWPKMKCFSIIACSIAALVHACDHAFSLQQERLPQVCVTSCVTILLLLLLNWGIE